ncbi:uncharacterized protein [Amphiura filiformis]|uniref:uncharacterized protein n=1 Tax=Amphiura filiformis TaxID=82378 RepID=UPI003B21F89D
MHICILLIHSFLITFLILKLQKVLEIVARWVHHDIDERKQVAIDYLQKFKIHRFPCDILQKALDEGMKNIPECKYALEAVIAIETKTMSLQRAFEISKRLEPMLSDIAQLAHEYIKENLIYLSTKPEFLNQTSRECMETYLQMCYNPNDNHSMCTVIDHRRQLPNAMFQLVTRWVNRDLNQRKQVVIYMIDNIEKFEIDRIPSDILQKALDEGMRNIPECKTAFEAVIAIRTKTMSLQRAFEISKCSKPGVSSVAKLAYKYMQGNFAYLSKQPTFYQTSAECMATFLETYSFFSDRNRSITDSKKMFEIVCGWVSHDKEQRRKFALEFLLKRFPLGFIPSCTLQKVLDDGLRDIPECKHAIEEVLATKINNDNLATPPPYMAHPNWFSEHALKTTMIHVGGKNMDKQCVKYWTNQKWKTWDILNFTPKFPHEIRYHSVVVANGNLCVAGGTGPNAGSSWRYFNGLGTFLNSFYLFDSVWRVWKPLASMAKARAAFALIHVDDLVYAIGGEQNGTVLSDVECYSLTTKSWESTASLAIPIKNPSAVVSNGKILVYGMRVGFSSRYALQIFTPDQTAGMLGGSWSIGLDDQQHAVRSSNTPKYVITVQNDTVYRVTHDDTNTIVTELECNFDQQPPAVHIGATEDQDQLRTILKNTIRSDRCSENIFSINKELYANVIGFIYKMGITDSHEDVKMNAYKIRHLSLNDNLGCVARLTIPEW